MKFPLTLLLLLTSLNSQGLVYELSYAERFEVQKVAMDELLLLELLRPNPDFNLSERMLAAKKERPAKKTWSDDLRSKLQAGGTMLRL